MTDQTVVAVFDTAAHADAAVADLKAENVSPEMISQHSKNASTSGSTPHAAPATGFWSRLFGSASDQDTAVFDRKVESGSTVVSVRASDEHLDRVSAILEKHHPIDLDEHSSQNGSTETTTTRTTPMMGTKAGAGTSSDGGTMQLSEEALAVGKRAVSGGTTRVRRYVVETPVEEQVSLHSEKVTLDRKPVTDGRPLTNPDFADKTMEMTETSEEAVVSKTARVKEEVSLRKEMGDRVETVKDTVRRDEVEIEQVPGGAATTASRTAGTSPVTPAPEQGSHTPKI